MRISLFVLATALALITAPLPAAAQEHLMGLLDVEQIFGRSSANIGDISIRTRVLRIPISLTLRPLEEHKVGLNLMLPLYFAINDVVVRDLDGQWLEESLSTVSLVPGLELLFMAGERVLVKPYAEVGGIRSLELGQSTWLAALGVRASLGFPFERWELGLGGRVHYAVALSSSRQQVDDLAYVDLGVSAGQPVFKTMGSFAKGGLFVVPREYLANPDFEEAGGHLAIDRHVEVGFYCEFPRKPVLFGVKIAEWYGVGYRFAGDFSSLRLYLGYPF